MNGEQETKFGRQRLAVPKRQTPASISAGPITAATAALPGLVPTASIGREALSSSLPAAADPPMAPLYRVGARVH